MPEQAQVRSVDALEAFRSHLVVYLSKARPIVEEISSELRRTQLWIETDRLAYWHRESLRRTRALEEAQQALLSARIATFREATPVQQNAVHAARRALEEAQDKLRTLKRWMREFGPRTEVFARQVSALESALAQDLPRAIAWLAEAVRLLEAYADVRREFAGTSAGLTPMPPAPDATPVAVQPNPPENLAITPEPAALPHPRSA